MLDSNHISCLVGDDHEALRRELVAVLEAEDDLRVIGQAAEGPALVALAERRRPDVTIVDVDMRTIDGIECCRRITARPHPPAVVLHTSIAEPDVLDAALDAGARGFVAKSGPSQDLVRAVRAVHAGLPFIDARPQTATPLSRREAQVLQHLADGLTTEGVGRQLFLSPATVRSYTENAMHKLDATNRVHAVAIALRLGLIS